MRRALVCSAILLTLSAAARPAQAASIPVINVNTFGIELCPQVICHAAIFTGLIHGQVGGNHNALGTFTAALTHEPLPDEAGETVAITGGVFELRVGLRRIRGVVVPGGTLRNNGDNTFDVDGTLLITSGGSGTLTYHVVLNHNTFPPTVVGTISQ